MTTNGTLLPDLAKKLRTNGLTRVNVSLPTLKERVYHELTGGRIEHVLNGIEAAVEAGLHPVKLNMLILKGINESDVPDMIEFASKTGTILQLIELEPINLSHAYYCMRHKSLDEHESMLKDKAVKIEERRDMQNRRIYHLQNSRVEVIRPIENTEFCMKCTRLRITSDGKLKPCLMRNDNTVDIMTLMRNGSSEKELLDLFVLSNERREPYNIGHMTI
jgi:cyclic pyranopterin phosphate synthase